MTPDATVVIVGPDGSGRTFALDALVAAHPGPVVRIRPTPFDRDVAHGGLRPLLGADDDVPDPRRTSARLTPDTLVAVDDAHHLEATSMRFLAAVAAQGVRVVVAHAPVEDRTLAALDEALLVDGTAHHPRPLDEQGVAAIMAGVTGRAAPSTEVTRLLQDCAGLPGLVAAAATDPGADVPRALADRVARRAQRLGPAAAALLKALAIAGDVPDRVLARLARLDEAELGPATQELAGAGLLVPDQEQVVPAVARVVLDALPGAERRRMDAALGEALAELGVDPILAAAHLRRARAGGPEVAARFAAAGDRLRYRDPDDAIGWYDEAVAAGASAGSVAGGRAEAAALLGLALPDDPPDDDTGRARLRVAHAVAAVREGRWAGAAELLPGLHAHDLGPGVELLAVPALVAVGDVAGARTIVDAPREPGGATASALLLLARAAVATADGAPDAVARFVEATEAFDRHVVDAPLLVLPHQLGAVVAARAGDMEAAEQFLGGRGETVHDQLLLAWVRLRAGRYDTAVQVCRAHRGRPLEGRDRLLLTALEAGLARRSGDIARLRTAWDAAVAALLRRTVDLWNVEALGELLLAATRLRQTHRVTPLVEELAAMVARAGAPAPWAASLHWLQLELALVDERSADLAAAADALGALAVTTDPRCEALAAASVAWVRVTAGQVALDEVVEAADALAAVALPWEGSRLAGQAAIRTTDPSVARRLLERARDLAGGEVPGDDGGEADGSGLSERELEVARYVADGLTHKEIGAQLYISPKTVEHHVARIRTKLGVSTRAEMLAALRTLVEAANRREPR